MLIEKYHAHTRYPGFYIDLEGHEGSGKTTHALPLVEYIREKYGKKRQHKTQ